MKAIVCLIGLVGVANAQAADFNFYASPNKLYSCTGYSTGLCYGFETSDVAHTIDYVGLIVSSKSPLEFTVEANIDGTPYKGYRVPANGTGQQFVMTANDGSFTTIMFSLTYAATRHCVGKVTHCTNRYLANAGTVSIP